ncbi:hypothetical protein [Wolinella succinogenes]|uniref:Uncharacterized protein n=1 Tax=Wolinella succinogenes (strain ATCC 29543 / DSM 1740 / CCUG 13145 / JCM 31913 / LMG 7466 / NCTC 11488 / FDC 602W) TaxID=273121 RepID=Q7MS59_WOLSU|nr:hypothetical protein [Wolinella succinogenes]NLU33865.1 hypothetical protein [Wolinella succinogenes]CAE09866.1 hypothetical protein WS0750 [Wolinella succinogenes]VEG82080.1 Uncharacterised protein [Wolinella succinogenes]HCZ18038.1 hypothetical protein [Helicobacter sp.]
MDASVLLALRDPAGVPFYPVVFQALYILTWALHIAFVLLALGSLALSLYGSTRQKGDENWRILTPHLIQTGKISVSILIVLGVAPLLFTQVIYDPNWYVANTLSGMWVFTFVYALVVGYSVYYWYSYANKAQKGGGTLIGAASFLILVFCGILMHNFALTSIMPQDWMSMYAPNGKVDTSGWVFNMDVIRLAFMVSLALPVIGIFLQNYAQFVSTRSDFSKAYVEFTQTLGTRLAVAGLLLSAVLFLLWMWSVDYLFSPLSIAIVVGVLGLLALSAKNSNSYLTTGVLVVVALLISGMRELIRFDLMVGLGYNIYDYPVNLEIPSIVMFLLTFLIMGGVGVAFLLTMAWKVGKNQGVFDASQDVVVSKLANYTLGIMTAWMVIYFAWGMGVLFKNVL